MDLALTEARKAASSNEVPVGCIIVRNGTVIATGYNQTECGVNPLMHAELIAISHAIKSTGQRYLGDCSLYVTLEPCLMCVGAIILARIPVLIYAADEPKTGAVRSRHEALATSSPGCLIRTGIREAESAALLRDFFQQKRMEAT